jgi:uncharacterized protein YggE
MEKENLYKWGWYALIALVVFLGVQTLAALKGLSNTDPAYNSITVSGEGEVFAVPDIASFSFTVSADASTVNAAQEAVTKKVDAILLKMEEMGIEEKDIKTTDYSVWPKYRYDVQTAIYPVPSRQVADGYTANHSVLIKVRATEKAGAVLGAAGSAGATNLSGISFTIDDPEKLREDARALAIKDARAKAELLTDELGVRLKKVVSYSDSLDGGYPIPYGRTEIGMGGVAVAQDAKAPSLPTGENKIKVVVNVVYEIR